MLVLEKLLMFVKPRSIHQSVVICVTKPVFNLISESLLLYDILRADSMGSQRCSLPRGASLKVDRCVLRLRPRVIILFLSMNLGI